MSVSASHEFQISATSVSLMHLSDEPNDICFCHSRSPPQAVDGFAGQHLFLVISGPAALFSADLCFSLQRIGQRSSTAHRINFDLCEAFSRYVIKLWLLPCFEFRAFVCS